MSKGRVLVVDDEQHIRRAVGRALVARGYQLIDIQQVTPHTERLGGVLVSRDEYLRRLAVARELPVTFGQQLVGDIFAFRPATPVR